MANKYALRPITGTVKEGFLLYDENENLVYEGQMQKFVLFGAAPFKFVNHITGKTEEHKIGKTATVEHSVGVGLVDIMSTKSSFKYDGKKIWDVLHDEGIRIDSKIAGNKLGMSYDVTLRGEPLATIANSSPKGKSIVTVQRFYDVTCEEKDLDLVFLVAMSIAKTEQVFYN